VATPCKVTNSNFAEGINVYTQIHCTHCKQGAYLPWMKHFQLMNPGKRFP